MAALSISGFLLVCFGEYFANETFTILGKDEAKYGPEMPHKTVLSIIGERRSIYKRLSNRLIRILPRNQRMMKRVRGVLISADLDLKQR